MATYRQSISFLKKKQEILELDQQARLLTSENMILEVMIQIEIDLAKIS